MAEIILASSNAGKIREFQALFNRYGLTIVPQATLGIGDAEETGLSFIENAILKARHASALAGKPAIADDSGLVVPALNGEPGIYSARYSGEHGDDAANNAKLLKLLETIDDRRAFFVCTIAYCQHAKDPLPIIASGLWHGEILRAPRGANGFGYDPLFWLAQYGKTSAELPAETKNAQSHRGQALRLFMQRFKARYDAEKTA